MSFAFVLIRIILVKDILHEFWSFSLIYTLVYNFLKSNRRINEGKVVGETQTYKPLVLRCSMHYSSRTVNKQFITLFALSPAVYGYMQTGAVVNKHHPHKRYSVYSLVSTEALKRPSSPSRHVHMETISIPRGIFQSNWQHIAQTL